MTQVLFDETHDVPNLFLCDGSRLVTSRPAHHDHTSLGISSRWSCHRVGKARRSRRL